MRRLMVLVIAALAVLLLAFAGFALWVRFAPTDPARWHLDPATAPRPTTPNWAEADRVSQLPPAQIAQSIATRARAEGATRIAGDDRFDTWEARSRLMGYPDYVTIRLTPAGEGTRIQAFSRARYGYGDGGVNSARLRRWLPD